MTDFLITSKLLSEWDACKSGLRFFLSEFKDGHATIVGTLDACARHGRGDDAQWLLSNLMRNQIRLPETLVSVAAWLHLRGYQHPLPETFTSVGCWLNLQGYTHPLPEGLEKTNEQARWHNRAMEERI